MNRINKYCQVIFFIKKGIFLFLLFPVILSAQEVNSIQIEGNKRTRDYVILRELTFKKGDIINLQDSTLQNVNEKRLNSLGIFTDCDVLFIPEEDHINVKIKVIENWYIYPAPIFELADRNFTEWWVNNNHELDRINYGLYIKHINLFGMRDRIKLTYQQGYTRKYEANYNQPYLTKDGKWGYEAFVFFANQREVPYATINNKTQYASFMDEIMLSRFRTGLALFYRPNLYGNHSFRLEYHQNKVNDYVVQELNPNFYLDGRTGIKYFYFNYDYTYDRRVFPLYPEGGYKLFFNLKKDGFGIFNEYNNLGVFFGGEIFKKLGEKIVIGSRLKIKANIDRRVVSFANNSGIGWREDIITAYEPYVIDGTDFGIVKSLIRYQLLDQKYDLKKWMPFRQFKVVNVEINARANFDIGYAHEPTYTFSNNLSNKILIGYGPALDIILYNNFLFSFRYGFNILGESRYTFYYQAAF